MSKFGDKLGEVMLCLDFDMYLVRLNLFFTLNNKMFILSEQWHYMLCNDGLGLISY